MFSLLTRAIAGIGKTAAAIGKSRGGRAALTTAAVGGGVALTTDAVTGSVNENIFQPFNQPFIDPIKGISTLSLLAITGMVGVVAFMIIRVVK